jgi:endo-1,4-beta-xylanase
MVTAARNAGLKMHGHTLIWHQQSPVWLAAGGEAYLNKFVTDVASHFKGKLISWDVVNEAVRDGLTPADAAGEWRDCLRMTDSPWNKAIGPEYIEKAFLAARAADPDVKLFYNDYNLNNEYKARAVYNMVRDINGRYPNEGGRKLIDGIGMQSHHHLNTNPQSVKASIELFASLGVEIAISEMDIQAAKASYNALTNTWDDSAAQSQAKQYAAMFRIFKDHKTHITRVTFWGLDDRTSWRANAYPTLLDRDYGLKPAFHAVSEPENY